MWLDFVLAGLLVALAVLLLYTSIFPRSSHPEAGAWGFIGAVVFFPTGVAFLTSGISMRRGGPWRWWAQLLPFAVVGGFLVYCGIPC